MTTSALHAICVAFLHLGVPAIADCSDVAISHGSTPLKTDRAGLYEAAVTLNGVRPLWFLVDTGANSSVLSRKTAERLNLRSSGNVRVSGSDGSGSFERVVVADYGSDLFDRHDEPMVVAGLYTDGIIGMNAFTGDRVQFDFARRELAVAASGRLPAGFVAEHCAVRFGNYMVVDVVIDGVRARAAIDTGSMYTIGNPKLQTALGFKRDDARLLPDQPLTGVKGAPWPTWKVALGNLTIGGVAFRRPTVRFTNEPTFHTLDLDDGPALILGVDQLSRLKAMAIDYPRAELQMRQ
jgi:predicted aspartyl protease